MPATHLALLINQILIPYNNTYPERYNLFSLSKWELVNPHKGNFAQNSAFLRFWHPITCISYSFSFVTCQILIPYNNTFPKRYNLFSLSKWELSTPLSHGLYTLTGKFYVLAFFLTSVILILYIISYFSWIFSNSH